MNYKESIEVNNFKINEYNNIMVGIKYISDERSFTYFSQKKANKMLLLIIIIPECHMNQTTSYGGVAKSSIIKRTEKD